MSEPEGFPHDPLGVFEVVASSATLLPDLDNFTVRVTVSNLTLNGMSARQLRAKITKRFPANDVSHAYVLPGYSTSHCKTCTCSSGDALSLDVHVLARSQYQARAQAEDITSQILELL